MARMFSFAVTCCTCTLIAAPALAQTGDWIDVVNETSLRLPTPLNNPALTTTDPDEKDYAWGDVDNDGDTDLVVVRKQPFTSTGKRPNVLLMNEGLAEGHSVNGVLVDRTAQYASAADVAGDQGFLTPTNDRDVILVDVNNDGWLDIVTAPTLTDNQAKHLSHPRVYINLGESGGEWLGFRFENARIPQMHATQGPRFCSVAGADLTGDGYADLYFGDYDSGGAESYDYNNKLLINNGNGFFTDQTTLRLTTTMALSAFGAATVIEDLNEDGVLDVLKQTSLNSPLHVAVTYNDPTDEGFFDFYDVIYSQAPYFVSSGDLNQDGLLDIVVTDDGTDRYMLNQGNNGAQHVIWTQHLFPPGSNGFGSQSVIADLDNDSVNDVLISDVDVDIPGCDRRLHIYRNNGATPTPTFTDETIIPTNMLGGTHNVAVFDLNEDGWLDIVIGRCSGTQVWMQDAPDGLVYSYPEGRPTFVSPGATTDFEIQVTAFGGGTPLAGSAELFAVVGDPGDGAVFTEQPLTHLGDNLYQGTLPAADCPQQIAFYITSQLVSGGTYTDPPSAPARWYEAVAADGVLIAFEDNMEADTSAWSVVNDPLNTAGAWQVADPNGTIDGANMASPEDDASAGAANVKAFVTENGPASGAANANDVDGGPTHLVSPLIDIVGTDAIVSWESWFYSTAANDVFKASVSNDNGQTWVEVGLLNTTGTNQSWQNRSFQVGDYVAPTDEVRVRFTAEDAGVASVVEAGIDDYQVEKYDCGFVSEPCPGDLDDSGDIGFGDLTDVLLHWGPCGGCPQDVNGDGSVGFADLTELLLSWGPCSP